MLTYVSVDGFRSLSHFELETRPGLNILIGPNGSGKSNIISFFQFLSRIMSLGLSDAVSLAGGVGAFFKKVGDQTFQNEIHVVVRGLSFIQQREMPGEKSRESSWIQYEYKFSVQASEIFDSIVFSQQKLSLKSVPGQKGQAPVYKILMKDDKWDLVVLSSAEPAVSKVIVYTPDSVTSIRQRILAKDQTEESLLLEMLEIEGPGLQSISIVMTLSRMIDPAGYIIEDLSGGETLNINPNKVKEPEDSAREPGIRSDGSGLAATLWHMTNEPQYRRPSPRYWFSIQSNRRRRRWPKELYKQLQSIIQLVNSQVKEVQVMNDRFDNQLKIKVRLCGEKSDIDLPLSAMSDGTIKWISMITAVLTSSTIFAIEEPECRSKIILSPMNQL